MDTQIAWVVELEIIDGHAAEFAALTKRMVEAGRAEPGTLVYERFIDEAGTTVVVYERYRDAQAAIDHLEMFGQQFAAEFMPLVLRRRAFVLGTVSGRLKSLLDQLNPEYLHHLDGFSRSLR